MTIKKRLLLSNILMILVPVMAALAAGACCIALLWLMVRSGSGLPLEDSGEFSWASRAVVKLVSRSLKKGKSLDTLGETLQANGMRVTVRSGGKTIYTWGGEQPDDARLLQAAASLGGTQALVSAGEHSLFIEQKKINGINYQIFVYGMRSEDLSSGMKVVLVLAGFVLLCAVLAAIWGTNRFLVRFVFRKINGALTVLSDGVREIGDGNLDYLIAYREKDEFAPVCKAFNEMADRLKVSVERTRQEEKSRKELLAGISHDLRSPLTSIQAYVEGLMDGVAKTPEAQQRYLMTVKTKAEDIDRMVSQLFLFSKLDMAEYPITPRTFRLDEFVTALVAETGDEYRSKGLEITVAASCPASVTADMELLRRVLANIMDNSAKYKTVAIGQLRISIEDTEKNYRIILSDDGPGVPEEALPKLFDAFYRSDPARKNPAGGSGLGLAIAARMVERMRGTITARNITAGGLEIAITLPKEDGHAKNSDC